MFWHSRPVLRPAEMLDLAVLFTVLMAQAVLMLMWNGDVDVTSDSRVSQQDMVPP